MDFTSLFGYAKPRACSFFWFVLFAAWPSLALGQEKPVPVGRCISIEGALLLREATGGWLALAPKDPVPADRLIVSMFTTEVYSADDSVSVKLYGDVGERGMFPVLESAIALHKPAAGNLDLTLDRGILVVSNRQARGAVKIRVRVLGGVFDVTLPDAKSRIAIERYGRHVPGDANLSDAKKDQPVTHAFFFAIEGEPIVENDHKAIRLQAPPGTSLLYWDDLTGAVETKFFDQLPEMVKPLTAEEKKRFAAVNAHARTLAANAGAIGMALDDLAAKSPDLLGRKTATLAMGALDDLPRLVGVLSNSKDAEQRDFSVLALRHWLGRESGHSIQLFELLTKKSGYTPVQAKNLLYLLNGIEEGKLRQPSTYDALIRGLNHSKLPVRELARWHLVRLVPDGKAIAYDAAATEPERLRAIEAWRKLVPEGELPAPSKKLPTSSK